MSKVSRAKDPEGSYQAPSKSFGSSKGSSKHEMGGGSAEGVGGKLSSDSTKDIGAGPHRSEPIANYPAYRKSGLEKKTFMGDGDGKFTGAGKPQTGLPRQEAAYVNRDRQGSGVETQPAFQRKLRSYPGKGAHGAKEEKKFEY